MGCIISSNHADQEKHSRLSRIDTLWSVVRRAHEPDDYSGPAQELLLQRYGQAIQRYLAGALRNQHAADELFQEFAVKLLKGDLRNANPDSGKFRSYVKTILFRMVANYHRTNKARKEQNVERLNDFDSDPPEHGLREEQAFLQIWREGTLAKAWATLEKNAEADGKSSHFTILRLRIGNPAANSTKFAELLSETMGKTVSVGNARVLVHRAREKFAHALFETIADSLDQPTRESVEAELIELGLIEYCRDALDKFDFE